MKALVIYIMRFGLNIVYFFMKFKKTDDRKVLFLSRQSDDLTEDFRMVIDELKKRDPEIKTKAICSRLEGESSGGLMRFAADTLRSMSDLADSKVAILDAYWPAVSILHHKPGLRVIQMWHAMGKIKQSGYQTLGRESGRSESTARLMKMHRGYDYIIAGGKAWNPFYMASFDCREEQLRNYGLPRIDRLISERDSNREKFFRAYPELEGKEIILYAPTFRRGYDFDWESLVNEFIRNKEGRALILKAHPGQNLVLTDDMKANGILDCPDFSSVDILPSADYMITDYSAIAVEAAVLRIRTLYYVPDFDEYRSKNGMNINLYEEMPGMVSGDASEIMSIIVNGSYDTEALDRYCERFLPEEPGTSTSKIAELIIDNLN